MSKKLEKEIDRLEKAAEQKKETEFLNICERYGNKAEELIKRGSEYEKNKVLEYILPRAIDDFMKLFEVFGSTVFEVAFENLIYPAILSGDPSEENEDIILGIDHAYLQLVYPGLWKQFMDEIKEHLKFDVDSEEWVNSRISKELKEKFDEARAERDKLKNGIREKMRKED